MPSPETYFEAHTHLLPPRRLRGLIRWIKRAFPDHPVADNASVDEIVAELRASGADYIVNLMFPLGPGEVADLHAFGAGLAARVPRLLPFAGVHPQDADRVEQVVHALDVLQFVGVKIHTMVQRVDPWDARLHPVYAELERRGRPLWLHTGFEYIYDYEFPDAHLRLLADEFPQMPIVLAHTMFPRLERAFQLAAQCPNILLDTTNVFSVLAHPEQYAPLQIRARVPDLIEVLLWGLQEFVGRVVFGTDHPAGLGSAAQIRADVDIFDISPPARRALLCDAPRALFESWAPDRMPG